MVRTTLVTVAMYGFTRVLITLAISNTGENETGVGKTNCLLVLKRTVSASRSVTSWNSREGLRVALACGVGFLNLILTYQTVQNFEVLTVIFVGIRHLVRIRSHYPDSLPLNLLKNRFWSC